MNHLDTPVHVARQIERLKEMYPEGRIETEVRWFVRVYGDHELCVDVRNLAHGDD